MGSLSLQEGSLSPFQGMVSDMDITPLYGTNYGTGSVKVFSGQYDGAPADSWGFSGLKSVTGPTRKAAVYVGKKEKQLEGLKQVILDLERRVAVEQAQLDAPALTPPPMQFSIASVTVEESLPAAVEPEPEAVFPEAADEDSGVVVPKKVTVSTSRRLMMKSSGKIRVNLLRKLKRRRRPPGKPSVQEQVGNQAFLEMVPRWLLGVKLWRCAKSIFSSVLRRGAWDRSWC